MPSQRADRYTFRLGHLWRFAPMSIDALSKLLQQDAYSMTIMPDGSGVLMDLHQETLLTFNGSAALMLEGIKDGKAASVIIGSVVERYEVDEETAAADLSRFVEELADAMGLSDA